MQPVYLFDLAFQRAEWLSVRQATVAQNVANADTPNYQARDVEPFDSVLSQTRLSMQATNPRHISFSPSPADSPVVENRAAGSSGEGVKLESELLKAGEVSRDYSLNVSIVRSFHRMWMASIRG